jgi:hypothetical protein
VQLHHLLADYEGSVLSRRDEFAEALNADIPRNGKTGESAVAFRLMSYIRSRVSQTIPGS